MFELSFAPLKGKGSQVKDGQDGSGCPLSQRKASHIISSLLQTSLGELGKKKKVNRQIFSLFLSPLPTREEQGPLENPQTVG